MSKWHQHTLLFHFNLFQPVSIRFNLFQSISIRFNLFQSDLIVKSKHGEIGEDSKAAPQKLEAWWNTVQGLGDSKAAPQKVRYQYMAKNQN